MHLPCFIILVQDPTELRWYGRAEVIYEVQCMHICIIHNYIIFIIFTFIIYFEIDEYFTCICVQQCLSHDICMMICICHMIVT